MELTLDTPVGAASAVLDQPPDPVSLLALGHGAGGDVTAPDLTAVRDLAVSRGVAVALVRQPYRVAGRRAPAPARQLDAAFVAVIHALRQRPGLGEPPLVAGGRSSGARVACRTASATAARGLVALAFPLHPQGKPERSRADELATGVPTLVLNGERDPFGIPQPASGIEIEVLPGANHSLRNVASQAAELVLRWLTRNGWAKGE